MENEDIRERLREAQFPHIFMMKMEISESINFREAYLKIKTGKENLEGFIHSQL